MEPMKKGHHRLEVMSHYYGKRIQQDMSNFVKWILLALLIGGVVGGASGGVIKPDVVLYEEGLDNEVVSDAIRTIAEAEVMIVGGTSLAVYPAAGLLDYFRGRALVLINKGATPQDRNADLLIQKPIGQIFSQIKVKGK